MKKLLALVLVCAIASLASATVILNVSSNSVLPGQSITVTVSSTDTAGYVKYLDMVKGLATFGPITKMAAAGAQSDVLDYSTDTLYDIGLTAADFTNTPTAGVHFSVVATAGMTPGVFTIQLLNDGTYDVAGEQQVTIIPEPATMLILSLGGLLLRKKA